MGNRGRKPRETCSLQWLLSLGPLTFCSRKGLVQGQASGRAQTVSLCVTWQREKLPVTFSHGRPSSPCKGTPEM